MASRWAGFKSAVLGPFRHLGANDEAGAGIGVPGLSGPLDGAVDGYYQMENHPLPISAWGGNTSNVMALSRPSHFRGSSLVRLMSSMPSAPCHLLD